MGNRLSSIEVEPDPAEKSTTTTTPTSVAEKPKKNKRSKTRRKRLGQVTNNKTLSNTPIVSSVESDPPPISQPTPLLSPKEILAMTDNGIMMDEHEYLNSGSTSAEASPPPPTDEPQKPTIEPRRRGPRRKPKQDA
jgi:hypothetical protein